jgi:hypothetical protein
MIGKTTLPISFPISPDFPVFSPNSRFPVKTIFDRENRYTVPVGTGFSHPVFIPTYQAQQPTIAQLSLRHLPKPYLLTFLVRSGWGVDLGTEGRSLGGGGARAGVPGEARGDPKIRRKQQKVSASGQ